MAQYTISLRDLLNTGFDIGLKDYPIYDEEHRETLNNMIINHYMMSEIGQETPQLFKLYLNNTMNEIMPKYNIIYKAIKELADNNVILGNVNMYEIEHTSDNSNQKHTGKDKNSNTTNQLNKTVLLDTPQGEIKTQDIDEASIYATQVQLNQNKNNANDNYTEQEYNSQVNNSGNMDRDKHTYGNSGAKYPTEVLKELQKSILNVDLEIINELSSLFIGLY
jgi:hypothetical protein